jgi:hypothetical protein
MRRIVGNALALAIYVANTGVCAHAAVVQSFQIDARIQVEVSLDKIGDVLLSSRDLEGAPQSV